MFGAVVAPLLQGNAGVNVADLQRAWTEALLLAGPSTSAMCFARMLAACGLVRTVPSAEELAVSLNARWAASQMLMPGAGEVLRRLARRFPLGLITNGPSDAQRAVVEALSLADAFRWVLVSGDAHIGIRKPDPAIFAHATSLAGSAPAAMLYVGDSAINDVAGAAAAGWRTCWLNRSGADLPASTPPPDLALRRIEDIIPALAGWSDRKVLA